LSQDNNDNSGVRIAQDEVPWDEGQGADPGPWRDAWDYVETQERLQKEGRALELREEQRALIERGRALARELAELDGRGDWTERVKPLGELGWLQRPAPERRALLTYDGSCVLPMGKVGFFVGEGGIGKSWALTQLAVSVVTGVPWLDTFSIPEGSQGGVLMAMGEEDPEEMHRRLRDVVEALGLAAHHMSVLEKMLWPLPLAGHILEFLSEGNRSWDHEHFEQVLRDAAPLGGWKLIVLDPASRFMGIDAEKDNAYATRFVQLLEQLTELPGNPTVLCSHHTNKTSRMTAGQGNRAGAIRGASALVDGARWQGNLSYHWPEDATEPDEGRAVFTVTKSNYGPKPEPVQLVRREGSGVLWPLHEGVEGATSPPPRPVRLQGRSVFQMDDL
jgi:hypothetical protein